MLRYFMARPRKSDQKREELLKRGIELLSEHGYHGTGLKKILDDVKIPKGSFYNYFSSKEDFVAEIIARYGSRGNQILDNYLQSVKVDPLKRIKAIFQLLIDEFEKGNLRGCLIGNIAAELDNRHNNCRIAMQQAVRGWELRFGSLIEEAQEMNLIRTDLPAKEIAQLLWSTWEGALLRAKIEDSVLPLSSVIKMTIDYLKSKN